MKKTEKKYIAPNEASLGRWIGTLVVGSLIGPAIAFVVALIFSGRIDNILGIELSKITLMLNFTPMFIGLVIAIKLVGKTSLKDFILGVGGKLNRKECLIVLVLSLISFCMGILTDLGHIQMRGISAGTFAASVLITLALIWMQTTYEELIFRGIFLRWIAKNDIGFNKKSILAAVISSGLFALAHTANVEVTSLSGLEQIAMVCSYAVPGMSFFLMSLYFGNLMPGIIMHWVNNFLLSTLISGEVASIAMPTLLVSNAEHNGYVILFSTLISTLPFVAYILWDIRKKKKAAAAN